MISHDLLVYGSGHCTWFDILQTGGGGWKCMMIGFVENYTSWKRIKSPIDQHTVCQFSSIIKATDKYWTEFLPSKCPPLIVHINQITSSMYNISFSNFVYRYLKYCWSWLGGFICRCFVHCTATLQTSGNTKREVYST